MRILHLTLHRKWFDLIAAGRKTVEYRKDTKYWRKRIFDADGFPKKFDLIHFRNGYGLHRPLMEAEFCCALSTDASSCSAENGEKLDGLTIVIGIGKILRFENYVVEKQRLCGGCGSSAHTSESLCPGCTKQLHDGRTAWVDALEPKPQGVK